MVRLDKLLNSWKAVREDTAQAVADFPAGEMDYKPSADLMTFGEIARHILIAGHGLTGLLLDGVDNLATPQFREMIGKYAEQIPNTDQPAALVRELRAQVDTRCGQLASKSADFYSQEITRFDGERVTRLEMLQMVKEHELTHRQQLFMYLRLKGIVPPTTRRRQAASKAKA